MREILYVSTAKMRNQLNMAKGLRLPEVQIEASLTGPKISASSPKPSNESSAQQTIGLLEATTAALDSHYQPRPYTDPTIKPYDWITFELQMTHRTAHRDDAQPWLPNQVDDIVLFAGDTSPRVTRHESEVQLLLCGSACHLTTQTASGGPLGSSSGWLYRAITEIHKRVEDGDETLPKEFRESPYGNWERTEIPYSIYRWMYDEHFSAQYPILSGYAQVWMNLDIAEWIPRLVVGTPLFVQVARPAETRGRIRRKFKRQRGEGPI